MENNTIAGQRMFKVSKEMREYVEKVLNRDGIPYQFDDEGTSVKVPVSGNRFHIVVEDALCEKQRHDCSPHIPVYSYHTLMNQNKLKRLRTINKTNGFIILKKDRRRYFNAVGIGYLNRYKY